MLFRIGGNRNLDIGDALDPGDEIGGIAIAARMRCVAFSNTAKRIAAQCDDMAYARPRVRLDHCVDLGAGGGDASQMGRRRQHCLSENALDRCVGALAR